MVLTAKLKTLPNEMCAPASGYRAGYLMHVSEAARDDARAWKWRGTGGRGGNLWSGCYQIPFQKSVKNNCTPDFPYLHSSSDSFIFKRLIGFADEESDRLSSHANPLHELRRNADNT